LDDDRDRLKNLATEASTGEASTATADSPDDLTEATA
jgi:hypothetical protein